MGKMQSDNHLCSISMSEAAEEGYTAELFLGSLFDFLLEVRFWPRGEPLLTEVAKIMDIIIERLGEIGKSALVMDGDRGYGEPAVVDIFIERGFSYMVNFPDHLRNINPFCIIRMILPSACNVIKREEIFGSEPNRVEFKRPSPIFIEDSEGLFMGFFAAKVRGVGGADEPVACAVRNVGSEKMCNLYMFTYHLPRGL